MTSPTGSSIQLLSTTSSPNHSNGAHPLTAGGGLLQGGSPGSSHLHGLHEAQSLMHMTGGAGGVGLMPAPSYDTGELTELKKRR